MTNLVDYLGMILTGVANPQPGDMVRRSVAGGWEVFSVGSAGQRLVIDESSGLPAWQSIVVSALPTASATYQGKILVVAGATGVADVAYICLKSSANTYSWKQLLSG